MSNVMTATESKEDKQGITTAVFDYLNGYKQANFDLLDNTFSSKASMFGVVKNDAGEEALDVWPDISEVIGRWSSNENPPGDLDGEILHMNVVDGRIATVLFRFGDGYFDALTLVKVAGKWEIAAKVFIFQ